MALAAIVLRGWNNPFESAQKTDPGVTDGASLERAKVEFQTAKSPHL